MASPVVDSQIATVYVGSHDNHVYALDAATDEKRWSVENPGWVTSEAVPVDEGIYYVGDTDDTSGGAYRLEPME